MTFANFEDYLKRNPDVTPGSQDYIETLLEDASQLLTDLHPVEVDNAEPATLERIVISMVSRKVASAGSDGFSSVQMGAGPYQASYSIANPSGDMYLTKLERKALGVGGARAYTVQMTGRRDRRLIWGDC